MGPRAGARHNEGRGAGRPEVIDLASERRRQQHARCRERLEDVLAGNRRALGRLFATGLIFTRRGARAGRELLLAHQHLLALGSRIDRAEPGAGAQDRLGRELDLLSAKSDALVLRTAELVAPGR